MRTLARSCFIALAALMLILTSFNSEMFSLKTRRHRVNSSSANSAFRCATGERTIYQIYNNTRMTINAGGVTVLQPISSTGQPSHDATLPANTIKPARGFYYSIIQPPALLLAVELTV
jgi:hypothetical protein